MKTETEFRKELKPFLEMVKAVKTDNNKDFLANIDEFKKLLVINNICGIKENPLLLDKLIDEIIEE